MSDITNQGERAAPDGSPVFLAHLSIYGFATRYTASRRVLDVGSGTGYGAAHLANHGASVTALEGSAEAVAYSRANYPGVAFQQADLNQTLPLPDAAFDVVFSSNVFEHIPRIDQLISECARVLHPDGVLIVAVPPVTSLELAEANIRNRWHVHHIPPWAWRAKLGRWFAEIETYGHLTEPEFAFPAMDADDMQRSTTAIFVCRGQRAEPLPETLAEREPAEWCYGAIAARVIGEAQDSIAALRAELDVARAAADAARQEADTLRRSTSWRITAPLRAIAGSISR